MIPLFFIFTIITLLFVFRFLSKTSLLRILSDSFRSLVDCLHVYQSFNVSHRNENFQENILYRNVSIYLNSLQSLEDAQFTNLFTGCSKPKEILISLDDQHAINDTFLGSRVSWKKDNSQKNVFVLTLKKKDKRRILRPYLQHILSVSDQIEETQKEIRLYINLETRESRRDGRWTAVPFNHPATMETVVLDAEVKKNVKSDLETFLKSKQYYHRLGRVWKRSYLLYGAAGTGKSSFVAAMARFLCYDVYDIDLCRVSDEADLKTLLMQTTCRSLIVVEGLDRVFSEKSRAVGMSGLLDFMDGIVSCCGEERVMVFTVIDKGLIDDQTVMRPGRIDVHVHFPLCDFSTFKVLANNYLGVKEHKHFVQIEEGFQNGPGLSPAQVGELMISNRASPTRALKSVITALERSKIGSDQPEFESLLGRESAHTFREFRKLYGLLRIGSRRKEESFDYSKVENEFHDQSVKRIRSTRIE
ncbi:hypothetical protein LWI29_025397 [Acer saccharum]|uniref:AAA+ ATPase domain-containing protein n=1 Tax=Acer saccharum TaxID=4024 RepID=A0AA39SLQ1_ACESA|nr:hypothetical protein LWI29_025397 [Acer saccharum]